MTSVSAKPLRRETPAIVRGRPMVIELYPWGVRVREKGRRFAYEISYAQIYDAAAKVKAREDRAAKAAARKR